MLFDSGQLNHEKLDRPIPFILTKNIRRTYLYILRLVFYVASSLHFSLYRHPPPMPATSVHLFLTRKSTPIEENVKKITMLD